MNIIINDGSKEANESLALEMAIQSKNKFGKSADIILSWLSEKSCILKEEAPDFILKGSSGVTGIEHFKVSTGSVGKKGKMESLPDKIYTASRRKNEGKPYDQDKIEATYKQAMLLSNYSDSICAFEYNFNKHLGKVESYKKRLFDEHGGCRLVFLIEMVYWDFTGMTAVGKKTFDWDFDNIPLYKDIVDFVSVANNVDAVVILFNFYPRYSSTVFAFTPQEAKNRSIGVEVYEYIGYGKALEIELIKMHNDGVTPDKIPTNKNFEELNKAIDDSCKKSQEYICSGKSCIVPTFVYEIMVDNGLIKDNR